MRVGLLHPGEMGAAIGALLVDRGHDVLWCPQGRSEATARRATAAGLRGVEHVLDAEAILSVCPPHAALDVARSLAGTSALVIDANAVSPMTADRIGELIGDRWADGGIVGPPPRREGTTRLYLSGHHAVEASLLFEGTLLGARGPRRLTGGRVRTEDGVRRMDQGLGGTAVVRARQRASDGGRRGTPSRVEALATRARRSF